MEKKEKLNKYLVNENKEHLKSFLEESEKKYKSRLLNIKKNEIKNLRKILKEYNFIKWEKEYFYLEYLYNQKIKDFFVLKDILKNFQTNLEKISFEKWLIETLNQIKKESENGKSI